MKLVWIRRWEQGLELSPPSGWDFYGEMEIFGSSIEKCDAKHWTFRLVTLESAREDYGVRV